MLTGAGKGLVAGAAGVAVMTLGEKVEQAFTHRPNSFVPAHTLERLLGLPSKPDGQRRGFNLVMHWGQGIALGALRGVMAEGGLRGPWASAMFTVVRLTPIRPRRTSPVSGRRRGPGLAGSCSSTCCTRASMGS
jgi:hypothetical protein